MLQTYLVIMLGGAIGSALRFAAAQWLAALAGESFPIGTLFVNVTGSFVIGIFGGLTEPNGPLPVSPLVRYGVVVGLCGGYTTFSSFSMQTFLLARDGEWFYAGLNVVLSTALCLAAVWLGVVCARLIASR